MVLLGSAATTLLALALAPREACEVLPFFTWLLGLNLCTFEAKLEVAFFCPFCILMAISLGASGMYCPGPGDSSLPM